jgi:hypothetical protein
MSDQWETFCDVGYYHMWRLRRKTERGWNDGFHINTKAEAEGLCELLNKLERWVALAISVLEFRRDLFKLQEQQLNDVRAERDRLAAIARELTAMIRVNVMWGRFAECSVEQIDEHLKPWNEKIAAVKGGSDERR